MIRCGRKDCKNNSLEKNDYQCNLILSGKGIKHISKNGFLTCGSFEKKKEHD